MRNLYANLKLKAIDVHLLLSLIAISTIPFFKSDFGIYYVLVCIIILKGFITSIIKIEIILMILIVLALEFFHYNSFDKYDLLTSRQALFFFLCAIFTSYYLKLKYLTLYINIMYVITYISFLFFSLQVISPNIIKAIVDLVPSIFIKKTVLYGHTIEQINPVIFNFDHNFYKLRNNGPFWEPTVFASMLIIAQIFNYLQNKKILNKVGVVFSIGIITTFSTTVYITYFILITATMIFNKQRSIVFKVFFVGLLLFAGSYAYYNTSILSQKINEEIMEIDKNIDSKSGDSRMASALLDLAEIQQDKVYLFFGKGGSKASRIGGLDKDAIRNCGVTALLVQWGILFFVLYVGLLYYSFYKLCEFHIVDTMFAIVFTICILIISFSEVFFDLPFFHSLIFFGFIIKRYYPNKILKINKNTPTVSLENLDNNSRQLILLKF